VFALFIGWLYSLIYSVPFFLLFLAARVVERRRTTQAD
jgi:hypothetical protein